MALQEIQDKFRQWKTDDIYRHSKSFREYQSDMVSGEYYLYAMVRVLTNKFLSNQKHVPYAFLKT